jgi:uncharacterized protein involved in cysteine biosynthesis
MISIILLPFQFAAALFEIVSDPKLRRWCVIPYLIGVTVFTAAFYTSYEYKLAIADYVLSFIGLEGAAWLSWVVLILGIFICAILAVGAMLVFGGIFIENFIEEAFNKHGVPSLQEKGISAYLKSVLRGLRDGLLRLVVYGTISLLALSTSFVPPLSLFFTLLGGFTLGVDLFELPLSLLGHRFSERVKLVFSHKLEAFSLGMFFSLFLIVPLGGVIFLPLAYLVAVKRIARWAHT